MSTASAVLLIPLDITESMIAAGTTVPVVDSAAGEVAWDAAPCVKGDKRNHNGWIWEALKDSTNVEPGTDATAWLREKPSNRMAPFDEQINTRAVANGSITYALRPGFFTGIALYGLHGDLIQITIYDEPGGDVIDTFTGELFEQAAGLYEYLFMPLRALTKMQRNNLPLYPDAELHITVSAANNASVGIGMIIVGHWMTLLGTGDIGGVEYGAEVEIKTYSYIKTNDDGTTQIVPRHSATNVNCSVVIDAEQGNHAADLLTQVASRPVAFIGSGLPRYSYINTFGLVSGTLSPESWPTARVNLSVKGYI